MGTWSTPNTVASMDRLERLMSAPIPASKASDLLYSLVGDDTLFDTLSMAEEKHSTADVRPLVAMTLDAWGNWHSRGQWLVDWEPGCLDRCRELASRFADSDIASLVECKADMSEAGKLVRDIVAPEDLNGDRFVTAASAGPGTSAVFDRETGEIYRIEPVWGLVIQADEETRADLHQKLFPGEPPTSSFKH